LHLFQEERRFLPDCRAMLAAEFQNVTPLK